jgi:hypothetical protein
MLFSYRIIEDYRVMQITVCRIYRAMRIVSKRKGSRYSAGRSPDWLKSKNPASPAVKREAEEDWHR